MTPDESVEPTQLGNYDIDHKIAEGGMGIVYKAHHRASGKVVAIKVIHPETARNPDNLKRFLREYVAAQKLNHPNVVRAIEMDDKCPQPYLVMEFVNGESLGQRVGRTGAIPEAEAIRLITQACEGLEAAHKHGLIHRDIKPDNILVTRDGVAKVADLGLVKTKDEGQDLTKPGRGLGAPLYMAPEQFRDARGVDVRADIYGLGATLYAMVTGVAPFTSANPLDCWMRKGRNEFPSPKSVNPAISDRVDWAIRRAMSAEPSQRPSSCREFREDLRGQSPASSPVAPLPDKPADIWYMMYRDQSGKSHTVKGSTDSIRDALKQGLLGDTSAIQVSRTKAGNMLPLANVPEFRDLVVAPAPLPPVKPSEASPNAPHLGPRPQAVPPEPRPRPRPRPAHRIAANAPTAAAKDAPPAPIAESAPVGRAARPSSPAREAGTTIPLDLRGVGPGPGHQAAQSSCLAVLNPGSWFRPQRDPVDCSVFAPPSVPVGGDFLIQVFAHLPDRLAEAERRAQAADDRTAFRFVTTLGIDIPRGTELAMHLLLPDAIVADPFKRIVWQGRTTAVPFVVTIPPGARPGEMFGTVRVCLGGVPCGHLNFKIAIVSARATQQPTDPGSIGFNSSRYRQVFVSYASPDRGEVLKRVQMLKLLKIQTFQDVLNLEPGDRWEGQLYRYIDQSDLFLLFWSSAAAESPWVRRELQYAIHRKGGVSYAPPEILPVVIEGPPPPEPPPELQDRHFNDPVLYFISPGRR